MDHIEATKRGIKKSLDTANRDYEGWENIAYMFLKRYIKKHPAFMCEDVRHAAIGKVPTPRSQRSWGGILLRAQHEGLIRHVRFSPVKNIKAHSARASVWHRVALTY